jgi:hypothetical protein
VGEQSKPRGRDDWPTGWIVTALHHGQSVWPELTRRWREQRPVNGVDIAHDVPEGG